MDKGTTSSLQWVSCLLDASLAQWKTHSLMNIARGQRYVIAASELKPTAAAAAAAAALMHD